METEIVQAGAAKVRLIAENDRIVLHIRRGKGFEPQSRALWGAWCAAGGTVLDIGAYSGLFAIAAALLGCTAHAFEPMPFNAERAAANAQRNGVHIKLHRAAVADRAGTVDITFNPKTEGMTAGASLIRRKGPKLTVPVLTIDSLALGGVVAVKIDVERAEPLVLAGMRATLERCRPKLLVEALGRDERAAVLAAAPGYALADVIDQRNLVLLPK